MRVIGVIDLMRGRAVHGRGGRRSQYQDVAAAVGVRVHGDPDALARAYVQQLGLDELYVADLDAIESAVPQDDVVRRLTAVGVPVMVDAGVATMADAQRLVQAGAHTVVVGLETLPSFGVLSAIRESIRQHGLAFSLDLREGIPLASGPATTGNTPEEIARRAFVADVDAVIVLDVARVGMGNGPDFDLIRRIRTAVPEASLLAGGGIRGLDDLRTLSAIGCDGALVATALHDGRLTAGDVVHAKSF